jgi:hypothetical protein
MPLPSQTTVSVKVKDDQQALSTEATTVVDVSNVPPVASISSSSPNALAGTVNPVTFTGTATDVSADTNVGFKWRWAIDTGTYGSFGAINANTLKVGGANNPISFSTCGTHTVKARAMDKDGGVLAETPAATKSVSVYSGAYKPPLVDGTTNLVQKGQVVPVKACLRLVR